MSPVAYVCVVVVAGIAGAALCRRLRLPRLMVAAPLLLAAAAVVVPVLHARSALSGESVAVSLPGRPLQTQLRAGLVFVYAADADGRPVLTALDPDSGRERFAIPGDDGVVADDGSVLVRAADAFVAYDAAGRRLWSAADPAGGQRRLAIAFGAGRAILADPGPGPSGTRRYRLLGIDRAGRTAWTRSFIGTDSPYAEVPQGFGPVRLREDVSDLAALRVAEADWDGRPLRGTNAVLTLDGELLQGPSGGDARILWARGGRVVVGRPPVGGPAADGCRLEGYEGGRRRWVSEDCRSFADLRPTAVRDQPVFRDADGRLRRVDPAAGTVIDVQVQLEPVAVAPCVASGGPQRQAPTDGAHVLAVADRTVSAFSLTDRDGPDLTHVVAGDGDFRACIGAGAVTVTTAVERANPFLRGELRRIEVFSTRTGRRTASRLVRGDVLATDGWAPGRSLVLRRGGRTEVLGG